MVKGSYFRVNSNDSNKKEFSYNLENVNAYREKRTVALVSVIVSIALATTKVLIGYSTNSLGILSEAMHVCDFLLQTTIVGL